MKIRFKIFFKKAICSLFLIFKTNMLERKNIYGCKALLCTYCISM